MERLLSIPRFEGRGGGGGGGGGGGFIKIVSKLTP